MFQMGWFNHQVERNSMRLSFRSPITGPGPQNKVVVLFFLVGEGRVKKIQVQIIPIWENEVIYTQLGI